MFVVDIYGTEGGGSGSLHVSPEDLATPDTVPRKGNYLVLPFFCILWNLLVTSDLLLRATSLSKPSVCKESK